MAEALRVAVNPADKAQYMVLFSNGRIVAKGGALDPMSVDTEPPFWQPEDITTPGAVGPARDFQVIDWSQPSGYTLDYYGGVHAWGPSGSVPDEPTSPDAPFFPNFPIITSFVMNPVGNGEGYHLAVNGTVSEFGGAPAVAAGPTLNPAIGYQLVMQWSSKKYYVLDEYGSCHARNGAAAIADTGHRWNFTIAKALEIVDWATGAGYVLDGYGGVHAVNGAEPVTGAIFWEGWDIARDFVVVDDGTDPDFPLKVGTLDGLGPVHFLVVSRAPAVIVGGTGTPEPADPTTTTTRPTIPFAYDDPDNDAMRTAELVVYDGEQAEDFDDEIQTLTMSGGPTGGTFQLRFGGYVTGNIARNASAATIEAALEALWPIGTGGVSCSGGPVNTTPVIVTFAGRLAHAAQPRLVLHRNAMIGGTAPTLAISRTNAGANVWSDLARATAIWSDLETVNRSRRAWDPPFDLGNGIYRAFMRVTDVSKKESPTASHQWEQDVVVPDPPTLAAVDEGGLNGIRLQPTFPDPPAGAQFVIEFSDDYSPDTGEGTWEKVRFAAEEPVEVPGGGGGEVTYGGLDWTYGDLGVTYGGIVLDGGFGVNTRVDYEAPFGRPRWYRCRQYVADPFVSSGWSEPVEATLSGGLWSLTDPFDHRRGMEIAVAPPEQFSREAPNSVLWPAGAEFPLIGSTGPLRAKAYDRTIRTMNEYEYVILERLVEPNATLLIRDPHGRIDYVKLLGEWRWTHPQAGPTKAEQAKGWGVRHYHEVSGGLIAQARPRVTDPDPFVLVSA